jgi:hypothetical protein
MNIAAQHFRQHGWAGWDVLLKSASAYLVVVEVPGGYLLFGCTHKQLWPAFERLPREERHLELQAHPSFEKIMGFAVLKKGWFAFSDVQFVVASGKAYNGKTDKAFAEFVDDMYALGKVV